MFPCEWKTAKVTSIYKSGPKSNLDNYRPISIISVTAKTKEKLAYNGKINLQMHNTALDLFTLQLLHC